MLKDIDRRAFNRAAKECNLEDFHFHELQHTWQVGMFKTEPLYLPYKNWGAGRR